MANFRAINTVCEAVMLLLRQTYAVQVNAQPDLFNRIPLSFEVYQTRSFDTPMVNGVSLFLYHVTINSTQRTIPVPPDPITGANRHPQLPLDLHFVLIPWGKDASLEQHLLGWVMRVLEDNPRLPSGLLNAAGGGGFATNEMIEIAAGTMTTDEMFHIWEVLPGDFRISAPYIARVVRIDSDRELGGGIVLTRDLAFGRVDTP